MSGTTGKKDSCCEQRILSVVAELGRLSRYGQEMKKFALIGAAGYIAPRHLGAIKETGHQLVAAYDPHDSVGVLDSYFPDTAFFTEFERFDRHIEMLRRAGREKAIDYVTICSPNYLHDAHVRFALRVGADAICEKPLVLNPWNIDALEELVKESGCRVNTILQLRLHPSIQELRHRTGGLHKQVNLRYITARGRWYDYSWKGDESKSGGLTMNIGIHFFDMLLWLYGEVKELTVHVRTERRAAGTLQLSNADVHWYLSVDEQDLPESALLQGQRTYRSLSVDGEDVEFSSGFEDLHTKCYREIYEGRGFTLDDVRPSISLVHAIRNASLEQIR